ncbi:MAG: hypothetical protein HYV29_00745 [Ignavibacteriales bacterium]|nr:hypothetical protein [Ignavibacteriales bacterium]
MSDSLTFGEKFQLRFHTMMCDACRRYEKQSALLENLLKGHLHQHSPHDGDDSAAEKTIEKIIKKIS